MLCLWDDWQEKGLEEFEDKVDKIANGQDGDSWISQLYNKFSSSLGVDGNSVDAMDMGDPEGLEPPILDETWGLEDIQKLHEQESGPTGNVENEDQPVPRRYKRSSSDPDDMMNITDEDDIDNQEEEEDEYTKSLAGQEKCRVKFWKCLGGVAQGSLHYMNEPGGISGAVQKMLFRVAFHGGMGNVWKALMTIPEARNVKRCMNKQDQCLSYEVLRQEVQQPFKEGQKKKGDDGGQERLLINPEFVESMDNSDGSDMFSPEDQAIEDAAKLDV